MGSSVQIYYVRYRGERSANVMRNIVGSGQWSVCKCATCDIVGSGPRVRGPRVRDVQYRGRDLCQYVTRGPIWTIGNDLKFCGGDPSDFWPLRGYFDQIPGRVATFST